MKKIIYAAVLIVVPVFCFALEWPTQAPEFLMFFGQRGESYNNFYQGLIFKDVQTARASEDGKHLISIENRRNARSFPSTLGNAVILVHEDGLQTIYGNLENTDTFVSRTQTESLSVVGKPGKSGWGDENTLIFQVADTEKRVFINPLLLMPSVSDTVAPQIHNAFLVNSEGHPINLSSARTVKQGSYDLYANITDRIRKDGKDFAPFRVTVLLNGADITLLAFEVLADDGKDFYLQNAGVTGSLLYSKPGVMYLGKITVVSGKTELTVNARDISGNEKIETFAFYVE